MHNQNWNLQREKASDVPVDSEAPQIRQSPGFANLVFEDGRHDFVNLQDLPAQSSKMREIADSFNKKVLISED
ncbi:hypothetical protein [Oryza sativa Japonica Group]|uniref:Uncharacterized protein n=1 Tax=Oryza sativa subsp. japonica TaxID=39947 RepID=Q5VR76_ORYSJ|nr:hypothetical protein [Oryza sativa Japonica Group]